MHLHTESLPPVVCASLSWRDRTILELTRRRLAGSVVGFGTAVRALQEATEAVIPSGRIYHLADGPVIGSLVSRIGIVARGRAIHVVRVDDAGRTVTLEPLVR